MCRERHIPLASLPESAFDNPLGEGSGAGVIFGNTGGVMEAALRTAYELAAGGEVPRGLCGDAAATAWLRCGNALHKWCPPTTLARHPSLHVESGPALHCAGQPLPKLEMEAIRGLRGIKQATVTLPPTAPAGMASRQLRVAVASGIGQARHLLERMHTGHSPHFDFVEVGGRWHGVGWDAGWLTGRGSQLASSELCQPMRSRSWPALAAVSVAAASPRAPTRWCCSSAWAQVGGCGPCVSGPGHWVLQRPAIIGYNRL